MNIHKDSAQEKAQRIEAAANCLDRLTRDALRKAATRLTVTSPALRKVLSAAMRIEAAPAHQVGELIARMKEDGLSHFDARVFAASFVTFVDSIYSDEATPSLDVLGPKCLKETSEASAFHMIALSTRCPSDAARALDETTEEAALVEIIRRRLQQDAVSLHRPITAAR